MGTFFFLFLVVFVPLQVLQFFSYLNFEFGVKLMSDLCLEYCVLSKLREVSSALDTQVGDGGGASFLRLQEGEGLGFEPHLDDPTLWSGPGGSFRVNVSL